MSPSERRKSIWKKSTRKRHEHLRRLYRGTSSVAVGLTEGIEMPYIEILRPARSGKVYISKALTDRHVDAIVFALLHESARG